MNLVWLRNDLRLEDNPALYHASQNGPVVCAYAITPQQWQQHDDAPAKVQLWGRRLQTLSQELATKCIPLKFVQASNYQTLPKHLLALIHSLQIKHLWFNHEYPLNEAKRDAVVCDTLEHHGIQIHRYHGDVVFPPGALKTQNNSMYHVFSPFARQWRKQVSEAQLALVPKPRKQQTLDIISDELDWSWFASSSITDREDLWPVKTQHIHRRLSRFVNERIIDYQTLRDIPSIAGTSTLSPYLACGAISTRQCIDKVRQHLTNWRENTWVNELIWREFYRHLTAVYPHLSRSENFKRVTKPIPWENDERQWQAWCNGETGYPVVDAAMKQLLQTGWMHNRLRMIVAAFLTKLLLIDWRRGEQFFMQHLIDGDYAANNGGWQWAASTGADAAPYFRIFNPERQSEKFDSEGKFIKKFLPNLTPLDSKSIHNPNTQQRQQCHYPEPIVDYRFARQRALDGYASAMGKTSS